MQKTIIFLRGLNTGGLKITMKELKSLLDSPDFQRLETVLATGNVLIESSLPSKEILAWVLEKISQHFGTSCYGQVRTFDQLQQLVEQFPTSNTTDYNQMILFCAEPCGQELLTAYQEFSHAPSDGFFLTDTNDCYWQVKKGTTTEGFGGKILGQKKYRQIITSRNLATCQKILQKFSTF